MNTTNQAASSKNEVKNKHINMIKLAASPKVTVICLVLLTILVVWGTIYQAEHGLYQAQEKFFHSWFFFLGGVIPFPGTVLVMFALFFNLVASLAFRIRFRLSNTGNIITHVGILILLVGGFLTFYYSGESALMLKEGETSNVSSARDQWELAIWESGKPQDIYAVDSAGFDAGEGILFADLDLQVTVDSYYENCSAYTAGMPPGPARQVVNASGIKYLEEASRALESAANIAGGVFAVRAASAGGEPQFLLLYGQDTRPTSLTIGSRGLAFSLQKKKILLPIEMTLLDFRIKYYPNTTIPKSYESQVSITQEDGMEREVVISMNKPLRVEDYTFFQSSYQIARDGTEYTILAVVKNAGRLLPYYSSITIFAGLVIHFLVMLFRRRKEKKALNETNK
jgi:hypothetical protein